MVPIDQQPSDVMHFKTICVCDGYSTVLLESLVLCSTFLNIGSDKVISLSGLPIWDVSMRLNCESTGGNPFQYFWLSKSQ